ncbi:MAG TPA: hypothetical protein PLZ95_22670 [Bryobacteraceae bacterium]|nr:hypothetical protein [Bryobacteraceae bacterium]
MERRSFLTLPVAAAAMAAPTPPLAGKIKVFGMDWAVIDPADWKVEGTGAGEVLQLVTPKGQEKDPRRPIQFALAETAAIGKFTIEVEVKKQAPKGSLIIVYAWERNGYFNYLHLSDDMASKVEVHNGVFHCYGGDRVRISPKQGPATLPTEGWHKVKMTYDASKGLLEAWVDGQTSPSLKAIDLSLGAGRIGIGSFFNTGSFRNFKLTKG